MTESTTASFQRARRPEQRLARREAILDAAEGLLAEAPVEQVSLRELSRRVGLGTSNVARYFPTREAVFLEVLDRARGQWLDDLEQRLAKVTGDVQRVADTIAASVAERPLLGELLSVLARILERNVDAGTVRDYKLRSRAHNERTASLLAGAFPGIDERQALELSAFAHELIMALWPLANPNDAVREALEDPRLAASRIDLADRLSRALVVLVTGYQHGA